MKTGYIMLQRQFFSHWLWEEERSFSKAEAFLDLLQLAAFAPTKRTISGALIELDEGEFVASVRYLCARWTWGKDKVAGFMKVLEKDGTIRRETRQGETIVILCNYKHYNGRQTIDQTANQTANQTMEQTESRQRADKVEEGKEGEQSSSMGRATPKPQPKPLAIDDDDDAESFWTQSMPTDSGKRMAALQSKINTLHPSWRKRPHFSAKELHALGDNAAAWLAVSADDWALLTAYLDARIPDEWRKDPRDFFQPDNRLALINIGPSSILSLADNWERKKS
jgi:hypothetical protein